MAEFECSNKSRSEEVTMVSCATAAQSTVGDGHLNATATTSTPYAGGIAKEMLSMEPVSFEFHCANGYTTEEMAAIEKVKATHNTQVFWVFRTGVSAFY